MKFKGKEKTQGITLIALIITIIVMLILAGVSINAIVGDNGIINSAMEANFKAEISQYKEDVDIYVLSKETESNIYDDTISSSIYAVDLDMNSIYRKHYSDIQELLGADVVTLSDIDKITSINKENYRTHLAVDAGELTWCTSDPTTKEVEWSLELGLKVWVEGRGYLISKDEYLVYSKGEYTEINGVYFCVPDLKGFNTGSTYYVTYDETNTIAETNNPIYNMLPLNWYDYSSQKWANIVTIGNSHIMYYTWIPRYVYKITDEGVDIKFVDTNNSYIDNEGNEFQYIDLQKDGYVLADAFTFDDTELAGIWVNKYELSDPKEPTGFSVISEGTSITVESISWEGYSTATEDNYVENSNVKINITGNGINRTFDDVSLPYVIDNLERSSVYTITVTTPTYGLDDAVLTKTVSTTEGSVAELTTPDFSGFNLDYTYFVTYSSVVPTIGEKVEVSPDILDNSKSSATNAPEGWYDYANKNWANIVTIDNETAEAIYWVWIPRYEYKVDKEQLTCDIVFITKEKEKPDDGYTIPDAFTFDGERIKWYMGS